MDVLGIIKSLFHSLGSIFSLSLNINGFVFTLGQMLIGLIIISLSITLLQFLFRKD